MGCLSGKKLGAEIACLVFLVGRAALAGLAEFELGVRWEEALVVGWAFEVVFSSCLERVSSVISGGRLVFLNLRGQR